MVYEGGLLYQIHMSYTHSGIKGRTPGDLRTGKEKCNNMAINISRDVLIMYVGI